MLVRNMDDRREAAMKDFLSDVFGSHLEKYEKINVKLPLLICSFGDNEDERIHQCLEDIEKEIDTWRIEM